MEKYTKEYFDAMALRACGMQTLPNGKLKKFY